MKLNKNTFALTILAIILGLFMIFLLLPGISTSLFPVISQMNIIDASFIVGYLGIMLIFLIILITFILFDRKEWRSKVKSLFYSMIYTIFFINFFCLIYIGIFMGNVLYGIEPIHIIAHFFNYMPIIAINTGSPTLIWFISGITFGIIFLIQIYLSEKRKKIVIVESKKLNITLIFQLIELYSTIIIYYALYRKDDQRLIYLLIGLITITLLTSFFHLILKPIVKRIRKEKNETIFEHILFYVPSYLVWMLITFFFFNNFIFENWIFYSIQSIILTILIFYNISALHFVFSEKFNLFVDIFSLIVGIAITSSYILVMENWFYLVPILSITMLLLIFIRKIY